MSNEFAMQIDPSYELIGARNVRVEIGGKLILDEINLKIGVGERVAILGANGAGKTSLLRALSGTLPVTSGEVILCTEPLGSLSRATIARSIAVVGADLVLPFATRADELVALGRLPHGRGPSGPTAHDRERAAAALERVGASHLAARDVRTLSAGEKQLIAIALGLAQETPILALDEPTVHLDLKHRVEIADLLVSLADHARTVVAIFHEIDMVRQLFPRVILMKSGRIVADGSPESVLTAARIADAWGIPQERAAHMFQTVDAWQGRNPYDMEHPRGRSGLSCQQRRVTDPPAMFTRLVPDRITRLLFAQAPRPRDPLATLLTLGIVACAVWDGLIHLGLGSLLFTLNGIGFLGNAGLLFLTLFIPRLRYRVRSYAAAWLALYAALTIAGYLADGAPRSSAAIAALFAEGGMIVGAAALYLAYRSAYTRIAAHDEPREHWVSAPSPAPFLGAALAAGLFFFLAANPWAKISCEVDPTSDAQIAACGLLFDRTELSISADTPTMLRFENRVATPHNVAIHRGDALSVGEELWRGELLSGPASIDYTLPPLPSGRYAFVCSIHPTMVGTLEVAAAP